MKALGRQRGIHHVSLPKLFVLFISVIGPFGRANALQSAEVIPMRFLSAAAACLICTAGFAQSPQPGGPPPGGFGVNQAPRPSPMPLQGSAITQNSRVRAFNAGPDGQVRSIYLTNGSVVDVSSGFGPGFSSQIHKGTRIRIVGSRTMVNGQSIVTPQQLTIGQHNFAAEPNMGPNREARLMPPPNGGPGMLPPPGGVNRVRRGPEGGPMRAGMTPPHPAGPGMPPPPPPAGPNGPGQPPLSGRGLRNQPGTGPHSARTPGNIPPPPPAGSRPAPGAPFPMPAPTDLIQPAPAPPSAPNL